MTFYSKLQRGRADLWQPVRYAHLLVKKSGKSSSLKRSRSFSRSVTLPFFISKEPSSFSAVFNSGLRSVSITSSALFNCLLSLPCDSFNRVNSVCVYVDACGGETEAIALFCLSCASTSKCRISLVFRFKSILLQTL